MTHAKRIRDSGVPTGRRRRRGYLTARLRTISPPRSPTYPPALNGKTGENGTAIRKTPMA